MKIARLTILAALCLFNAITVTAASAWIGYTPQAFAQAQAAGKTIVVDVAADWCPTCKAQHPILEELSQDARLEDSVLVRVDFDQDKDFLKAHKIPRQSTILVFRGATELARSIAETNRDRLHSFVFDALAE